MEKEIEGFDTRLRNEAGTMNSEICQPVDSKELAHALQKSLLDRRFDAFVRGTSDGFIVGIIVPDESVAEELDKDAEIERLRSMIDSSDKVDTK